MQFFAVSGQKCRDGHSSWGLGKDRAGSITVEEAGVTMEMVGLMT